MTVPLLALLVPLALGAAGALAAFLVAVVEAGVSRLRVSLWRLHDDIVDDLVEGRFADGPEAMRLLHMVRRAIVEAKHLTVLRVFGTFVLYRLSAEHSAHRQPPHGHLLLGETSDALVNAHARRLVRVLSRGTFETSLLGRLCQVAARRTSREMTEQPVRTEVQLDYALHPATLPTTEMATVAV